MPFRRNTKSHKCSPPATVGEGAYTVTVIANGIASNGFTYQFPGATHLQVVAAADATDTATPVRITVTALNGHGNLAAGYQGTIHFTSSDPKATLPADYTFTTADAGVHTFQVTLTTPGNQTITATDTATGTITGTATAFHEFGGLSGDAVGDITGPDGNLWFTEGSVNKIGQMSPAGVVLHEFAVPTANSAPAGITAGPDGNLWFTEDAGNKVGRITPAGVVTEFVVPTANSRPDFITAGPDGNLWFTETAGNKIGRITPAGVITEFTLPNADSQPQAITAGPDGNLWFTEIAGNRIGRITPAGVVTEFAVPRLDSYPLGIAAGSDGNLWFTESVGDNLGRITPAGVVTEFPLASANTGANYLTADRNGNLWFDEEYHNAIGLWNIAAASLTEYMVPTASILQGITVGPDGNAWFGESGALQMGRIKAAITVTPAPLGYFDITPIGTNPDADGTPFAITVLARDPNEPTDASPDVRGEASVTVAAPQAHHRWSIQLAQAEALDLVFLEAGQRPGAWLTWGDWMLDPIGSSRGS